MFIYQITNILTKDCYVGKTTKTIEQRLHRHNYNAFQGNSQTYLHRAIRKYGAHNFIIESLESVNNFDELNIKEMDWIKRIKPRYNMTKGGDGGDTSNSPNYIKAISKRCQKGINNGMFGKKHSEKTIEKIRKALLGKSIIANKCPVMCQGKKFDSVGEAQKAFPGISVRKRLDNPKYSEFYRLRPRTKRK